MYSPPAFREDRAEVMRAAVHAHPLGTLITAGAGGPTANVLPFLLRTGPEGNVLYAHLARANDQVADLRNGTAALVLFQGPQAYVSPSWYPSKQEHGRVVPTWNYIVVQIRGTPRIIEDETWLRGQLDALTTAHEAGREAPWQVADAPDRFVAGQLKGIVGLELPVARMEGKWKVSQNRSPSDRHGVVMGLRADGHSTLADEMARRSAV